MNKFYVTARVIHEVGMWLEADSAEEAEDQMLDIPSEELLEIINDDPLLSEVIVDDVDEEEADDLN